MLTPKQQRLVELLVENYGLKGNRKTLQALMLEAGYSANSAKNPKIIIEDTRVGEAISPLLAKMEEVRDKALKSITDEKLKMSSPRDATYIADTLTKNIQLLSGGETERAGLNINIVKYGGDATPQV